MLVRPLFQGSSILSCIHRPKSEPLKKDAQASVFTINPTVEKPKIAHENSVNTESLPPAATTAPSCIAPTCQQPITSRLGGAFAFTLVELLVVMGVIGILSAIAVPAFVSINSANRATASYYSVAEILEQARQFATAQNTYVWVGFYQDTSSDDLPLRVALVASKDGRNVPDWDTAAGLDAASGKLLTVGKVESFSRIGLVRSNSLLPNPPPAVDPPPAQLIDASGSLQARFGGTAKSFKYALQFTPAGEAKVSADYSSAVEFGLVPLHAANSTDKNNPAVIRVSGLTGRATLFRP